MNMNVNLDILSSLFFSMSDDSLSYFLSEDDYDAYYNCDLKNYDDFIKWFPKVFFLNTDENYDYSDMSIERNILCKNALQYFISSILNTNIDKSFKISRDVFFPGLDNIDIDIYDYEKKIFLMRVYQYLFKERFTYKNPRDFCECSDNF